MAFFSSSEYRAKRTWKNFINKKRDYGLGDNSVVRDSVTG